MELIEALRNRRSIRKFKDVLIEDSIIEKAIDNARFYPSWKNSQTVRFVLVKDTKLKEEISKACLEFDHNTQIINNCPEMIIVLTIKNRSGYERDGSPTTSLGSHFESFDAGIATQNLMLSLYNENIGSCVLGIYDDKKVREILSIDDTYKVSCLLPIGYPLEEAVCPKRKDVSDILTIK